VEVPQVQYIDRVVDVPVVKQRQVPSVQKVQKTVEVPQVQYIVKVVDVPVVKRRQVPSVRSGRLGLQEGYCAIRLYGGQDCICTG